MRFPYFVVLVVYLLVDLSCVFACILDIISKLDQEQNVLCNVGEDSLKYCISCNCVRQDTLVCTKFCDKLPPKGTKYCFRPKLEKHMSQKLSAYRDVEERYKKIADLAKGCKVGEEIEWDECKCCNCVCAAPGVSRCQPQKGCNEDSKKLNRLIGLGGEEEYEGYT